MFNRYQALGLSTFHAVPHLTLTAMLWDRYYHLLLTNEESRHRGGIGNQPKGRELINSRRHVNTHTLHALIVSAMCFAGTSNSTCHCPPGLQDTHVCMCVHVCGWVGGCAHWQRPGQGVKQRAVGDGRASPPVTMMKLAVAQLSVNLETLFNFLCFFIFLRRVCTRWPHPEFCAWGSSYFICPLVPEWICWSSLPKEASFIYRTDQQQSLP